MRGYPLPSELPSGVDLARTEVVAYDGGEEVGTYDGMADLLADSALFDGARGPITFSTRSVALGHRPDAHDVLADLCGVGTMAYADAVEELARGEVAEVTARGRSYALTPTYGPRG